MGEKCSEIFSLSKGWPKNKVYWLFAASLAVSVKLSIRNLGGARPGVPWHKLMALYLSASCVNSIQIANWSRDLLYRNAV